MTRVNALLLIAAMCSALYLVRTQYESRRLYTEFTGRNPKRSVWKTNTTDSISKEAHKPRRCGWKSWRTSNSICARLHRPLPSTPHPVMCRWKARQQRSPRFSREQSQRSIFHQPVAGQQDADLAQPVHRGLHRIGFHRLGVACGVCASGGQCIFYQTRHGQI